jgi:hypothetical protein
MKVNHAQHSSASIEEIHRYIGHRAEGVGGCAPGATLVFYVGHSRLDNGAEKYVRITTFRSETPKGE